MRHMQAIIAGIAVLVGAPLLVGCGEKKTKDYGIEENSGTQKSALEKLAARGPKELLKLVKSSNSKVRMDATYALGYIKDDPEATKALIQMIETAPDFDAANALMALGLQGPDEAKAIFQKYVKDERAEIRIGCTYGIAEYGDSTLYPLLDELATNDPDELVRKIAATNRMQLEDGRYVPFAHKSE